MLCSSLSLILWWFPFAWGLQSSIFDLPCLCPKEHHLQRATCENNAIQQTATCSMLRIVTTNRCVRQKTVGFPTTLPTSELDWLRGKSSVSDGITFFLLLLVPAFRIIGA